MVKKKSKKLEKIYNKARGKAFSQDDSDFIKNVKGIVNIDDVKETKIKASSKDTYKNIEFLEVDHIRLQKIERIYSKKLFILSNFSQTDSLIKVQNEEIIFLKEKLKDILLIDTSRFISRIEYIWDDSYGNFE